MKLIRLFFTVLLLLVLIIPGGVEASAANTGFSTEPLPEEDADTFLQNAKITMLTDEPQRKAIQCFSVNEQGLIAVGCSNLENKTVCIYTSDGDFLYGCSFACYGRFGVELDNRVLSIYFVRSSVAVSVDPAGEIERVLKIQNTSENNAYWHHSVFATRQKVGDTEYVLQNDMGLFNVFASSYSQLITIKNGEKSILYDVNATQCLKMAVAFVGVLIFLCIAVAVIVGEFRRQKLRR